MTIGFSRKADHHDVNPPIPVVDWTITVQPEGIHPQSGRPLRRIGGRLRWHALFDETGNMKDRATHEKRLDKFLGELIWMSKALRLGRETISI